MFDSTPDVPHTDQLSEMIRYLLIDGYEVKIMESFIDFISLDVKTAELITNQILAKLQNDELDIQNCYGQVYYNTETMAGVHHGVQKCILNLNPKATFVPCNK